MSPPSTGHRRATRRKPVQSRMYLWSARRLPIVRHATPVFRGVGILLFHHRRRPAVRIVRHTHLAPADGHLLRAGSEGQRAVLRPEAGCKGGVDEEGVDLRPAYEKRV